MKKPIESVDQFNKLVSKYLNKQYINNASRLVRDYKNLIYRLYYLEKDNCLLFLEECPLFYNLYYFILKTNPDIANVDLTPDKPIVADEVYTDEEADPHPAYLLRLGFDKYLTRVYMKLEITDEYISSMKDTGSSCVNFVKYNDLDCVLNLQNKYIDTYTGNALSKEEMSVAIENNLILGAYEDGFLVGYLRLAVGKKTISIEGIVVNSDFRGKGYSKQLISYLIEYFYKKNYNRIDLWVRDDNMSALGLYNLFGFKNAKYKCDNYIKFQDNEV